MYHRKLESDREAKGQHDKLQKELSKRRRDEQRKRRVKEKRGE